MLIWIILKKERRLKAHLYSVACYEKFTFVHLFSSFTMLRNEKKQGKFYYLFIFKLMKMFFV